MGTWFPSRSRSTLERAALDEKLASGPYDARYELKLTHDLSSLNEKL